MSDLVSAIAGLNPTDEDDWFVAEQLSVRIPHTGVTRWFFATKTHWLGSDLLPTDAGLISCAGVVGLHVNDCIRKIVGDQEIRFVGDLDALDIVTFLTLRQASVRYVGVHDDWLELASAMRRSDGTIRMTEFERRAISELETRGQLNFLGPRARALLAAGLKLELEGASNPALYEPGFREALRAMLFDE